MKKKEKKKARKGGKHGEEESYMHEEKEIDKDLVTPGERFT